MSEQIEIRPYDLRTNEAALLALHALHFPGPDSIAKRRSYVSWLLDNPRAGSIYLAAYVDGNFAGFLAFLARDITGFGRTFRGALAAAAMTLPQFAGRGLYRRLANTGWETARRAGFDLALGYTIRSHVLDLELRMGWSRASVAPVMAFPLDAAAILQVAIPKLGMFRKLATVANPFAHYVVRRFAQRAATPVKYVIARPRFISPEFDQLTDTLRMASVLNLAKDRDTINWLYQSPHNPFDYDIFEARRGETLVGFAVGRRMYLLGLDGYAILDLIAVPGHEGALKPLAAALVLEALQHRPQIIGALVSVDHPSHQALRGLGFINTHRSFTLIFRPLRDGLPEAFKEPRTWCNFWGNTDSI